MENRRASTLPLVSIGVPVHNEERHLAEALSSLDADEFDFKKIEFRCVESRAAARGLPVGGAELLAKQLEW